MYFYGHISPEVQDAIFDVYRTQLSYGTMHIETPHLLEKYEPEIMAAIKLINEKYPLAFAQLASRSNKNCSSFKERLLKVARKAVSKFILKDKEFEFVK